MLGKIKRAATVILVLLALELLPLSAIAAHAADFGYVNNSYLNLRADTSTDSAIVMKLSEGDVLELLDDLGGWYEVIATHNGTKYYGYVAAQYVGYGNYSGSNGSGSQNSGSSNQNTGSGSQTTQQLGYVNHDYLNLRALPGGDLVIKLSRNDVLHITDYDGGWYEVIAEHAGNTYVGYVYEEYVALGSPSKPTPTPVPDSNFIVETPVNKAGYVNNDYLNLRASATTESNIIMTLSRNDELQIRQETNGWYKVTAYHAGNSYDGYVFSSYVARGYPSIGTALSGVVDNSYLNLREQPSLNAKLVVKLDRNDRVYIIEKNGNWYHAIADHRGGGYIGYLSANYIKLDSQSSGQDVGYVNHYWLNLRAKPTTSSDVIVVLAQDDKLILEAYKDGWYRVTAHHNGNIYTGYVAEQYVSK